METRLQNEIDHGKKLASHAEEIWNWSGEVGKIRANRRADLFIEKGKITKSDKVLEIGCGTGLFTEKVFTATNAEITAIDISNDLIEQARVKLPAVHFKINDAMNLEFEDNSFDVVFGSSVLHHLNINTAMLEIYRVLRKNGRIVFAEPNMLNPQILIQKNVPFVKKIMGDSPDETAIVRWNLQKMMNKSGFKNVRIFPYDFLHPVTPVFLIGLVRGLGSIIERTPLLREIAGSVFIYGEK